MKVLKFNELDILILKYLVKNRSAVVSMLRYDLIKYDKDTNKYPKGISYTYLWQRIHILHSLRLISVTETKSRVISIVESKRELIGRYLYVLFKLEEEVDDDKNV